MTSTEDLADCIEISSIGVFFCHKKNKMKLKHRPSHFISDRVFHFLNDETETLDPLILFRFWP